MKLGKVGKVRLTAVQKKFAAKSVGDRKRKRAGVRNGLIVTLKLFSEPYWAQCHVSEATIRSFRIIQSEGAREVSRAIDHYNLDAILAVGYRVRSARGTAFRQWATVTRPA